jgi:hypothetical protein
VIEHIERHWCPSITSDQLVGGAAFRFEDIGDRPSQDRGVSGSGTASTGP